MRWSAKPNDDWKYWFAWYPVMVDDQWVWLEIIQRRDEGDIFITIWNYKL